MKQNNKWNVEQRLAYIDFRLKWYGKLNRADLTDRFHISIPQASLDIAKYIAQAPNNLNYDRSVKSYVRRDGFKECYASSSSALSFLDDLLYSEDKLSSKNIFTRIPQLGRSVDDCITAKIVFAIETQRSVEIKYQSMTRSEASTRRILPQALIFMDSQWHIRAFCFQKNAHLDFLLARVLEVSKTERNYVTIPEDVDWKKLVTLIIKPAEGLTDAQKAVIEYDYGMKDHTLIFKCRKAFLFYILKKYRFLNPWKNPQQQELQLENIENIKTLLSSRELNILSDNENV